MTTSSGPTNSEVREYSHITPYGYIKGDKVYLKGYFEFKDREIGIVRETDEESLQYFVNRYEMAKKKVEDVQNSIHTAENKGSYLMKLIHMRTYLAQYNGLGDFPELFEMLNQMEDEIREYIEGNREKNYSIKTALLQDAENLKVSTEWKEAADRFKELKQKWIQTGSAHKELEEELNRKFNEALAYFFKYRKDYFRDQAKLQRERMLRYRSMIDEVRRFNRQGPNPDTANRVKTLQQEWKDVGNIAKHKYRQFLNEFREEVSIFFTELKKNANRKPKTPLELKNDLIAETEEVLNMGSPYNIQKVKKLQTQWKELGKQPIPEDKDLNLKFRIVCNEIFESYFVDVTVLKNNPDFKVLTPRQQLSLKISTLKASILEDEEALRRFNREHRISGGYGQQLPPDLYQERNNMVNRIKTKQRILERLEEKMFS